MATGGRTLILCFDGTTNEFGNENTNVIKFFQILKKDQQDKQLVYYQPGIGTYENPGMMMSFWLSLSKLLDEAFAWYLDAHIMGGYNFLMQHYRKGDKICLFGFSRGAYTARCLAGMLHKVGLLPISNEEQVSFAYTNYANSSAKGWQQSAGFKKTFSISVEIEFVGCWDTVSSVGVIWSRHLPFSTANTIIRTFRHALALDEHRVRFTPSPWHRTPDDEKDVAKAQAYDPEHTTPPKGVNAGYLIPPEIQDPKVTGLGRTKTKTDVKEVWFAGCHGDVGGGSVKNSTPHALSFVPFRWMVEQTILCQTGILYEPGALHSIGMHTDPFMEARANMSKEFFHNAAHKTPGSSGNPAPDVVDASDPPVAGPHGEIVTADGCDGRAPGGELEEERSKQREREEEKKDQQIVEQEKQNENEKAKEREREKGVPSKLGFLRRHKGKETQSKEKEKPPRRSSDTHVATQSTPGRPPLTTSGSASTGNSDAPLEPPASVANETDAQRQGHDLKTKIHDQLKAIPLWWILEIIPMFSAWQDENGKWHRSFNCHLGRPRTIWGTDEPYVHVAVKERMEAGIGYKPRAKFLKGIQRARWTE